MQSVSSRIWTRVAVSNSYDDNDYTTGTSVYDGYVTLIPLVMGCKVLSLFFLNDSFGIK